MIRTATLLALSLLLAVPARGQEEGAPVLVLHDVADLALKRREFVGPDLELKSARAEIDLDRPPFGTVREGESPLGPVESVMDLVSQFVDPAAWEEEENRIDVTALGDLAVVAKPALQARVREFLGGLRRSLLRQVTVEARVLDFDPGAFPLEPGNLDADAARALLARAGRGEGVRIVRSARITGQDGQRFVFFRGRQRAFVQDHDVEVAKDRAAIGDPIVSVLQTGFALEVRPAVGAGRVRLDLLGQIASPRSRLGSVTTAVGPVQVPDVEYLRIAASPTVPSGGFLLVSGGGVGARRALLVSADVETPRPARAPPRPGVALGVDDPGSERSLRIHPVGDLVRNIPGETMPSMELTPWGGGGPGGFEEEPEALTRNDEISWLSTFLRDVCARDSGNPGAKTFVWNDSLFVRRTPAGQEVVERVLAELRAHRVRTVNVELSLTDRHALVTAADGQRTGLDDTALTSYVGDYDVEIADGSTIADPLVWRFRTGTVVQVTPTVTAEGWLVVLEIQATTARLAGEMESFETPVGTIQLPAIEQQKVWTTVIVPVGETAVVGGVLDPDDPDGWLLRVTPRVHDGS